MQLQHTKDNDLTVVTQNCFFSKRTKKVIRLINSTQADVYCLQEITSKKIAEYIKLKTGYDYIISEKTRAVGKIHFHNAIFTKLKVHASDEINYTKTTGKNFAGKAFWSILEKNGYLVKVYNCYLSINCMSMKQRSDIQEKILTDANEFDGRIVICGDMNTTITENKVLRKFLKILHGVPSPLAEEVAEYAEKNEKYIFYDTAQKHGFIEISGLHENTWVVPLINMALFNLKLDWVLAKGFTDTSSVLGYFLGDHRYIIGNFTL
jgi:endonuclease/exonuclease/phosphatase (EEP) superfamily protein YafD